MKYDEKYDTDNKFEKFLGKIEYVRFGIGGYQDAMFGLTLGFSMKGFSTCEFISGGWAYGIIDPDGSHYKWTEEDRTKSMAEMCKQISLILKDAKVDSVDKLQGKPVEILSAGWNDLKSWRILTELL